MVIRLFVILLAFLSLPDPAYACSCSCSCDKPSPCTTFWTADVVFIGRAQSVVEKRPRDQVTRFAIEEWLRGERVGSDLTISSYGVGGSCDYGFEQGTRYLVHATKRPDGRWHAFLCGGTAPLQQAAADLAYIRDALAHPGPGAVSGIVFLNIDQGERKQSRPIAEARLRLRASGREWTTATDKDGSYRFEALPAGEYTLSLEVPSAYQPVPPRRVAIGKDACARHFLFTVKR